MPFLVFVVGIVNTGWPRPLDRSRTSGHHSVLVLGNVSFEQSFSKIAICVNALYDARQHGGLVSAFSKVQEREIATSKIRKGQRAKHDCKLPVGHVGKRYHLNDGS